MSKKDKKKNSSKDSEKKAIAKKTNGKYFRARNPQELANIYALLDTLEPVEQDTEMYRPRQSLSYLPLLIALALSFLLAVRQCWLSR